MFGFEISENRNGVGKVNMIIVDTDVLIDSARDVDEAVKCLREIENKFSLAISSITQMELIVGCRNKNELKSLDNFLNRFDIISLDEQISDTAIELLATYRLSHGLLIADGIIAATAMTMNIPFVSKNQRDYRFIENLELLPYPNPFNNQD